MNGIPKNSVIRIFNPSSPVPATVFSVPLEPNYNGSLETLIIRNLTIHPRHIAKVQFCSNGGCGPVTAQTLGCNVCESLTVLGMVEYCIIFILNWTSIGLNLEQIKIGGSNNMVASRLKLHHQTYYLYTIGKPVSLSHFVYSPAT